MFVQQLGVILEWGSELKVLLFCHLSRFSSVQLLSRVWLFATSWTTEHQASQSITNSKSLLKLMPSSQWYHSTISSSVVPFFSGPQSFPALWSIQWVSSSHQVEKVLELQLQDQSLQWILRIDFLQDWLFGSSCSPRDSQESSPTTQFKSFNSSALSFLTLTSIHDYWKNHSFD